MSKNDITGDDLKSKASTDAYREDIVGYGGQKSTSLPALNVERLSCLGRNVGNAISLTATSLPR